MQDLLAHINNLTFQNIPVIVQSFENGSNPGYCHQNCFNYKERFPDAEIVRGWLKSSGPAVVHGYLLHSIISHNDQFFAPTPFLVPAYRGHFAIDNSIIWNDQNLKDWEFEIPEIGILPKKL